MDVQNELAKRKLAIARENLAREQSKMKPGGGGASLRLLAHYEQEIERWKRRASKS